MVGNLTCIVCGTGDSAPSNPGKKREGIACLHCQARRRDHDQAKAILGLISDGSETSLAGAVNAALASGRDLRVLELALAGPFIAIFERLPGYVQAYRWPEGNPNPQRPSVRYCDLEAIPFDDNSFDLVITSEVLPFVAQDMLAHREIRRVLRVGGAHVSSFSMDWPAPAATEEYQALAEESGAPAPRLFRSPDGTSVPLRRKYGMDLLIRLKKEGYFAALRRESFFDRESRRNVTLMAVKL